MKTLKKDKYRTQQPCECTESRRRRRCSEILILQCVNYLLLQTSQHLLSHIPCSLGTGAWFCLALSFRAWRRNQGDSGPSSSPGLPGKGSTSKLTHTLTVWIRFFAGCWTPYWPLAGGCLATWASPQGTSQQNSWLHEAGNSEDKRGVGTRVIVFYNPTQKWHPSTSVVFYSLEVSHWMQPTVKVRGLSGGVNTRPWGSLGACWELRATLSWVSILSIQGLCSLGSPLLWVKSHGGGPRTVLEYVQMAAMPHRGQPSSSNTYVTHPIPAPFLPLEFLEKNLTLSPTL